MIVVDASAVVAALTAAPGTDALRTLLSTQELHAPNLLDSEVVSALRRLSMSRQLSSSEALACLLDLDDLPVRRWPFTDAMCRRAFELRNNVTAYDAAYVALAEALECPLVTRDERLARSAAHEARIEVW